MSDLIDLTSPDNKKVSAGPKLSSPLIPLPTKNSAEPPQSTPNVNLESRRSIDNNPFDVELQKTNEFISKSEDPFEVVWQKAINAGDSESHSAEYNKPSLSSLKNDAHHKRKRHSDILKMNKTLDDSLIGAGASTISTNKHNESTIITNNVLTSDLNKLLEDAVLPIENKILKSYDHLPLLSLNPPSPDSHNLSILNQSVMDDSFSICSPTGRPSMGRTFNLMTSCMMDSSNVKDTTNQHNSSILNQSAMNDSLSGSSGSDDGLIKSIVARRIAMCIQKGITAAETEFKIPDEKYHRLRRSFSQGDQLSLKNIQQVRSQSTTVDCGLRTPKDSSMPAILYEDPFNRGFMTGSSSDNTTVIDISAISSIRRINSVASGASSDGTVSMKNLGFIDDSTSSGLITLNSKRSTNINTRHSSSSLAQISDLVAKYDRLKAKTLHDSLSTKCSLIDLDKETSVENISDSVFLDNNPLKQSMSSDELAKTFEKCSLKSRYGSNTSGEDSLPKRPPSVMELLSDNELTTSDNNREVVDNLIELQTSNSNKDQNDSVEKDKSNSSNVHTHNDENEKKRIDVMKEFDKELFEPDKKFTAATLLMELEKLVNNEKNPKAVELLENLERVLGVKCHNNVELLEMCIQSTEPMKDIEKNTKDDVPSPGESRIPSVDTSKEDNTNIDSSDSLKQLGCENFCINNNNNMDIEKTINKSQKLSQVSDCNSISSDDSTTEHSECSINGPQNTFSTQKLVVDIQIALQKLLTSNNSDPMAFLESLNKVLNPSVNESEEKLEKSNRIKASPVKSIPTSPLKKSEMSHLSTKSSTMRRSVDATSTFKKPIGLQRHSSVSQFTNTSNERNTKIKTRIDSPKKTISKRSSSDPDSIDEIKITKKISLDPMKLKPSVPIVNKKKLRTNNNTMEITIKKGPLKAFIPMGNMQQRRLSGKKVSPITIPPLSPSNLNYDKSSAFIGSTSTPNPDVQITLDSLKNSPKRKPVASSTPDINSKISRVKLAIPSSPKRNMSWNISPVTPNAPKISTPNGNLSVKNGSINRTQQIHKNQISSPKLKSRSSSIRLEKSPECQKKISFLPRGQLNQSEGKLRHGRRSEPVKNTITGKKIASPLNENNTPGKKINPLNLISKFQRRSNNVNPVEKENKWK